MIPLGIGKAADAVIVKPDEELPDIASALRLPPLSGTIAVVGGAAGLDKPEFEGVRAALRGFLGELLDFALERNFAVVDGGTASGAMRILGEVRLEKEADLPLIGVAPLGKVIWPGREIEIGDAAPLDVGHTAFVLVETDEWGGEADTLAAVAHKLAGDGPKAELLINGGQTARRDAWAYVRRGGALLVVEGTGRFADELASAFRRGRSDVPDVARLLDTGLIHLVPLDAPPGELSAILSELCK